MHHLAGVLLLAVSAILSVGTIAPPSPRGLDAPEAEFSALRAKEHLERIARAPHPTGSPAAREVRDYITGVLHELALDVGVHDRSAAARVTGTVWSARTENVVARLRGKRGSGPAIMLATHYDSVPQGLGASDAGSGVVVLLETARALTAGPRLEDDVLFVFTDGEELALRGAQAAVEEQGLLTDVKLVLNFEARGTGGAVAMFETSADDGAIIAGFAAAAPDPTASSFVTTLAAALPNGTDSLVWKRAGFAVLGFAYADGLQHYHRRTDSADRVDLRSVQQAGAYAVSLARYFGDRELSALQAPDVIYFDLFGKVVVRYGTTFARAAASATLVLLVAVLVAFTRARRIRGWSVIKGAAVSLGAILLAAGAVTGANLLLGKVVDFYMLVARGKVFAWHALFLAGAICIALFSWLLRKNTGRDLALGAMVMWAALLGASAVLAPAFSAPLEWPLLFALLGLLASDRTKFPLPLYVGVVPGVVMLANVVYAVFVAAGATMPFAPILFFGLLAGLLLPVIAFVPPRARWLSSLGLLVGSTALAVFGCVTARYSQREPRTDTLVYALDADTGEARWVMFGPWDDWLRARMPNSVATPLPGFTRSDDRVNNAPAPALPFAAPQALVRSDSTEGETRTLAVRVTSSRQARCLRIWDAGGARIAWSPEIDGAAVGDFYRFSPEQDESAMRAMIGDDSYRVWHMQHCGLGNDRALDLTLRAAAGGQVRLRVVEESDGLPELGGAPLPPRPSGSVPSQESDVVLVGRTFEL
jgi:hypothetical protein